MVFCSRDDGSTSIVDESFVQRVSLGRGHRSIFDDINCTYKRIKMVESFAYLGALFHWKQSAESAWADRQKTAFKSFGSLVRSLCMVPSLPFFRVKEVVYTRVGGAYLFAAELWAPLIPRAGRTPVSLISRDVLAWMVKKKKRKRKREKKTFSMGRNPQYF